MATLTITLPDEMAKIAEERGLLSPPAFEAYVRGQLREIEEARLRKDKQEDGIDEESFDFDPVKKGFVNPAAYGRGWIVGDIESPIDVEWEAMK